MNVDELEKLAANQRVVAKRLFGESVGRIGDLNDCLFVDAVINAAILEVALGQAQAMRSRPESTKA